MRTAKRAGTVVLPGLSRVSGQAGAGWRAFKIRRIAADAILNILMIRSEDSARDGVARARPLSLRPFTAESRIHAEASPVSGA